MTIVRTPPPAPGGKLPSCDDLKRLRHAGWSYQDFMDVYGVSNFGVSKALKRCGLTSPQATYADEIPWLIESKDRGNNHLRMLRLAARMERGTQGRLAPRKLEEFESWKRKLKRWDAVVAYGWHQNRAGDRLHGFYLTARRPGIDTGLIRVPDPTP